MSKLVNIIVIVLVILMISIIFCFLGYSIYTEVSYGAKEGTVIDKQYHRAYTSVTYQTIKTGNITSSIPIYRNVPESYQIKIQKEDGIKLKECWIEIPSEEYSNLKIGDYYGR